jgi:hypothetical protein
MIASLLAKPAPKPAPAPKDRDDRQPTPAPTPTPAPKPAPAPKDRDDRQPTPTPTPKPATRGIVVPTSPPAAEVQALADSKAEAEAQALADSKAKAIADKAKAKADAEDLAMAQAVLPKVGPNPNMTTMPTVELIRSLILAPELLKKKLERKLLRQPPLLQIPAQLTREPAPFTPPGLTPVVALDRSLLLLIPCC